MNSLTLANENGNDPSGGALSRAVFKLWPTGWANPALPTLVAQVQAAVENCTSILDVGCGKSSPVRFIPNAHLVGVDGYAPAVEEARRIGTHDDYVIGDVRNLTGLFGAKKFDACVALDVIEHLPKEDGWRMLDAMEKLANKRVVIFTPNGFVPQHSKDGDLQEHLSGWTAEDLRPRGYEVFGMCGPKSLRGEYHIIKYKPRAFWALVSLAADLTYSRGHPESAAAILAVKRLG